MRRAPTLLVPSTITLHRNRRMSAFGRFMSAMGGKADIDVKGFHFRF